MIHQSRWLLITALLGTGFSTTEIKAQNTFFETGDLILYVQKPGDDDTIYVGLGSAATLYRGSAAGPTADKQALNIVNITSALTSAYGAGWASDPGIYVGLAACRNTSPGPVVFGGDQSRTVYVSRPRNAVGTLGERNSTPWDLSSVGNLTGSATPIVGELSNNFETRYLTQVAIAPVSDSKIDNTNPFSSPGIQGKAFTQFVGGVQQIGTAAAFGTFGPTGSVEFALDLNRIVPSNDSVTEGEVSGVRFVGSYEGTIVIGTDGNVSFITQGIAPTSNFAAFMAGSNPPIPIEADRLPTADPDADGFDNLEEFVLNGNPAAASQAIAPLLAVTATDFVFSFTRRDDSESEAPAVFQYGGDLTGWTDVALSTAGTVGAATVVIAEGDTVTDAVSVTLPKTVAPTGKLFGRLKIVK